MKTNFYSLALNIVICKFELEIFYYDDCKITFDFLLKRNVSIQKNNNIVLHVLFII